MLKSRSRPSVTRYFATMSTTILNINICSRLTSPTRANKDEKRKKEGEGEWEFREKERERDEKVEDSNRVFAIISDLFRIRLSKSSSSKFFFQKKMKTTSLY